MFNKKAGNEQQKIALELLNTSLAKCETSAEYSYIVGVADLAFQLGLITQNQRADYKDAAYRKMEAIRKAEAERRAAERERYKAERKQKALEAKKK